MGYISPADACCTLIRSAIAQSARMSARAISNTCAVLPSGRRLQIGAMYRSVTVPRAYIIHHSPKTHALHHGLSIGTAGETFRDVPGSKEDLTFLGFLGRDV